MSKDFDAVLEKIERETAESGDQEYSDALVVAFEFAAQLIAKRKELGLTQTELAKRCGLNQSEISRIERGQSNPTLMRIGRISGALGGFEFRIAAEPMPAAG